jgi:hypothetical protein
MMRFLLALLFAPGAFAWEEHQAIVSRLLTTPPAESRAYLARSVEIPCAEEEVRQREELARRIQVREEAIPLHSTVKCGSRRPRSLTVMEFLKTGLVDEPDLGMDQNLPDAADPNGYRKWMGGDRGPTSQGFRHMVFPGMEWLSPLQTFQLPTSRIGEAFARIDLLGREAGRALQKGDLFWGLRLMQWQEHFLQDLYQPFHTTQIPSLRMVPWKSIFSGLVRKTTHAISNYHYAYEGMVLEWVKGVDEESERCFLPAGARAYAGEAEFSKTPRRVASRLGGALHVVLGDEMKSEEVDLPNGKGSLDYYRLLHARREETSPEALSSLTPGDRKTHLRSVEMVAAMERVKAVTCELMRELASGFWGNLDRAFQDLTRSNSSSNGR